MMENLHFRDLDSDKVHILFIFFVLWAKNVYIRNYGLSRRYVKKCRFLKTFCLAKNQNSLDDVLYGTNLDSR